MRYLIFGGGAIGGTIGARLYLAGIDVQLVARGAHRRVIEERGLEFRAPGQTHCLPIGVLDIDRPKGVADVEVVILATKSQDTHDAVAVMRRLLDPGVTVVCCQNGIANEDAALRCFRNVYGAYLTLPAVHLEPGSVACRRANPTGVIRLGPYGRGTSSARGTEIVRDLSAADLVVSYVPDPMPYKYAKLLDNLGNVVDALCRSDDEGRERLIAAARNEAIACLTASDIGFVAASVLADDRDLFSGVEMLELPAGTSSWQSLARCAQGIETDYLNGEISLMGRKLGIPCPVNEVLQDLAKDALLGKLAPRSLTASEILASAAA